ncbi:unnamed protein product [Caenorhabditis nigoni]
MDKETDYAKQQAEKHKRKIILPTCISWEYGSNKFASQKGQSAFGTIRNTKLNNDSDVQYWKKNDVVHYIYEQVPEGSKSLHDEQQSDTNSVPKFESRHSINDKDAQYKAWIGGQTTTFTPAQGLDKD